MLLRELLCLVIEICFALRRGGVSAGLCCLFLLQYAGASAVPPAAIRELRQSTMDSRSLITHLTLVARKRAFYQTRPVFFRSW